MKAEDLIKELPKGLIKWYPFQKDTDMLYIADAESISEIADDRVTSIPVENEMQVTMCSFEKLEKIISGCEEDIFDGKKFHYVVAVSILERAKEPINFLRYLAGVLKEAGTLLLGTNNRLGIRYFCGDQDTFTGRSFDGVENYMRISQTDQAQLDGHAYAKSELLEMLNAAGFIKHKFYSVFPVLCNPQILFAEDFTPSEELKIRIFPQYDSPDTVFLEEENLYTSLIQNGLLHIMANGFLIECPLKGKFADAKQITVSPGRGKKNALCTIIRGDGKVEKKPLYAEGRAKAEKLKENNDYLKEHGVPVVDAEVVGDSLIMPYIEGIPLVKYFRNLMEVNRQEFYEKFDRLWEMILLSSDTVAYEDVDWEHFDPWWDEEKDEKKRQRIDREKWRKIAFGTQQEKESLGVILKRGYIDLVLHNGLWTGRDFVFYDQEIYMDHMPAKAVMYRNINFLYHGDLRIEQLLPRRELLERYGVEEYREIFSAYERYFLNKLRNDRLLDGYYRRYRRNPEAVHSNRQRMNYSTEEYVRLFINIFSNLDNKKLYLFGSGRFAEKFVAMYGNEYEITGILDNDEKKQGEQLAGISISPPSLLEGQDASTYKVIICIKNYVGVLKQLRRLGVTNIGIYDTNMEYPAKARTSINVGEKSCPKKYHVGYVAGVFDLFHIGHLNLLRRAKEQCDYLIVGVVTDEGVARNKKTSPFIPFEERLALVQACRYVDKAVEIPMGYHDTKDAYLRFRFDVQFSGSDYAQDTEWLEKREFLRSHGAELVFFPYTESTSSSKIKEMIDRKLMR